MAMKDLVAIKTIVDELRRMKNQGEAMLVFNEVRKPHNSIYKKVE